MAEDESTNERCRRGRTIAILLALTATAASLALLPTAAASAAGCEADYCTTLITEPDGRATLKIPGKLVRLVYPQLKECTWEVEAQYGDGSPSGSYVFSEAIGLEAEHTYPEPGEYTFNAYATHGMHDGTSEPCPDVHIEATVIYPKPPPPPEEKEEPEAEGPGVLSPGGGSPAAAAQPLAPASVPTPQPIPYWRACSGGVRAHLVTCHRAKQVITAARKHLAMAGLERGATFMAAGFSCRLRGGGKLACRRGKQRVLGA
jgi:hypothetical protein